MECKEDKSSKAFSIGRSIVGGRYKEKERNLRSGFLFFFTTRLCFIEEWEGYFYDEMSTIHLYFLSKIFNHVNFTRQPSVSTRPLFSKNCHQLNYSLNFQWFRFINSIIHSIFNHLDLTQIIQSIIWAPLKSFTPKI